MIVFDIMYSCDM